jgi:hypothetical protein
MTTGWPLPARSVYTSKHGVRMMGLAEGAREGGHSNHLLLDPTTCREQSASTPNCVAHGSSATNPT